MWKAFSAMATKKARLGRLALPVWTVAVALVLVVTAAGQAVGPVLSGSIQGGGTVVTSQALILKTGSPGITVDSADQWVVTVNEEGTAFTVAMETVVGRKQTLKLVMVNLSGKDANGVLEMNVPAGIIFDGKGVDDVPALAQYNRTSFLFRMRDNKTAPNDVADIQIDIEAKPESSPGFYALTGRITQVAN